MLNNWFKKEKPFAGFAGFGGGATGLTFSGSVGGDGHTATGGLISDYVYNGEKYLGEAIESILAQTFTDFQLIVHNTPLSPMP